MTPVLVVLALMASAGAAVAASAREPRFATLGAVIALIASGYVADPLPGIVPMATRLAGVVLGGYLVWVALRGAPAAPTGPHLEWPGAVAIAVAAFAIGWLAAGSIGQALGAIGGDGPSAGIIPAGLVAGSPVARAGLGAALALVALAIGPVLVVRDVLRLGLGLLLLAGAADLLRTTLVGPGDDVTGLGFGLLIAVGGAGLAAIAGRSLRLHGDLELRSPSAREAAVRTRIADEAHELRHPR